MKSAGIIGAGLMGRLLAMHLIESGWQVSLFDKDDHAGKQSCGMTAAGMLSPCAEIETADSRVFDLGMRSIGLWPGIIKRLEQSTGHNIFWRQQGGLMVAHPQDQTELQRFINNLRHKLRHRLGHRSGHRLDHKPGILDHSVQTLDSSQITALEPQLEHLSSAYFFPHEAQISTDDLFTALKDFILKPQFKHQVAWHIHSTIEEIDSRVVKHQGTTYTFDMVFDCRGLGAKDRLKDLRAVRGELIWLSAPEIQITRPLRLMHPRYRLYLVPRPEHTYILGASEIEAEDYSPISVRTQMELLSAAYSIDPAFAEARIINTKVNCRPAFSDNQPKIAWQPEQGYCTINGLYRHGYLLAPALVQQVLEQVVEQVIKEISL